MKTCRRVILAAIFLCMLSLSAASALAEGDMQLADQAELLTEKEQAEINSLLNELEQLTGWELMAVTTNDAGELDTTAYAENWFDEHTGKEDGVICVIDMDNREIAVRAFGRCMFYITDKRADRILDAGYEQISEKAYGETLLSMFAEVEAAYKEENPEKNYLYDEDTKETTDYPSAPYGTVSRYKYREITFSELLIALGLAVGAGGVTVGVIISRYRLKLGGYRYSAQQNGSIHLDQKEDRLVNSFVTTRKIPRNTHNSSARTRSSAGSAVRKSTGGGSVVRKSAGGRSTVHRSAGGRRSSGGSRKF